MYVANEAKILTGVLFGLLALAGGSASDFIFGGCLVYDLAALAVGQKQYGNEDWSKLLGVYAGGTAVIVGLKNLIWWPYDKRGEGYTVLR